MLPTLLKSVLFGLLVAVCGLIVWVVGSMVVGLQGIAATGHGGIGAVSFGISGTIGLRVMLGCFAVGFVWMYRRLTRRAAK
jgi:hypothetical protein